MPNKGPIPPHPPGFWTLAEELSSPETPGGPPAQSTPTRTAPESSAVLSATKALPFPCALAPGLTPPWAWEDQKKRDEREAGTRPHPLSAISPTYNFSTFASGFLFLSNKQKITICNWAGRVWEGGLRGWRWWWWPLWREGLGKEHKLEKKDRNLRAGPRQRQRVQKPGFGVGLCWKKHLWASDLSLLGLTFLGSSSQEIASTCPSPFGRRPTALTLFHDQFT